MYICLVLLSLFILISMLKKTKKKEKFHNIHRSKSSRKLKINKIVKICNNILVNKENKCNCKNKDGYPHEDLKYCKKKNNNKPCENYHLCKKLFKYFTTDSEPDYNPIKWSKPELEGSHNCYIYMLDDKNKKVMKRCKKHCKENPDNCDADDYDCGDFKPQPGHHAFYRGTRKKKNKKYTCKSMLKAVIDDNKNIELGKFTKPCKKTHYKGYMVVDKENTYHFYRQDKNGRWSHKQGTLPVENIDASNNPIYVPHLADKNYNKKRKKDGINYDGECNYMCIPNNKWGETYAI